MKLKSEQVKLFEIENEFDFVKGFSICEEKTSCEPSQNVEKTPLCKRKIWRNDVEKKVVRKSQNDEQWKVEIEKKSDEKD